MSIVKKLLVATAAATVVGMVDANRANAVSVNLDSFNSSTGEYNYKFTLSPLEVDAFTKETTVGSIVTIAADKFTLTGLAGVSGQAVSGTADSFYKVDGTTSTSARWLVDQTLASTATLLTPDQRSFGTFTVTAPGTQLGTINYSVDTTISGTVPGNCSLIGVRSTCTGTTQGPVAAAAVPFELSPGLGSLALGVSGAIAYLKSLKKRKSFESELQTIDAN